MEAGSRPPLLRAWVRGARQKRRREQLGQGGGLRGDANWGRVLNAMGYSGVNFEPDDFELWFGTFKAFEGGEPVPHEAAEANAALSSGEVLITARLAEGGATAAASGRDLTYEYLRINGSYRT